MNFVACFAVVVKDQSYYNIINDVMYYYYACADLQDHAIHHCLIRAS